MIHVVRLPSETRLYLWQVVRMQMNLLCCTTRLEGDFTRGNIKTALMKSVSAKKAEILSEWLFEHSSPRESLKNFAGHGDQKEKRTLVRQMMSDVAHLHRGQIERTLTVQFSIPSRNKPLPDYLEGAQKFLTYFYEEGLDSGLSGALFDKNPCNFSKYGRAQFFEAFERENPEQYVCAICDEHRHMTILRGEYFSDIEHYFPKSIYPHLACHPYNLIPICKQCNTAHLDKDPLRAPDGHRRILGEIFLPYRSESIAQQGLLKLDWQKTKDSPILGIQSLIDGDDTFRTKLQAFSEIYNIPARWQGRIDQIGEQLWRYVRHFVHVEIEKGEEIDLIRLKAELEQLLGYLFEDLGKSPWTYVLIWYLGNILIEEIETALLKPDEVDIIPVLETVQDVLNERSDPLAHHRLRAKEVMVTARKLYSRERCAGT